MSSAYKTTSEKILDSLAEGASFADLQECGYDKTDLLTAALFGVAELHEEYKELANAHQMKRNIDIFLSSN